MKFASFEKIPPSPLLKMGVRLDGFTKIFRNNLMRLDNFPIMKLKKRFDLSKMTIKIFPSHFLMEGWKKKWAGGGFFYLMGDESIKRYYIIYIG
ncbi:MAG: hypothetical protein NTY64_13360 [Deltaproteobacteria bacterium]|nr:hypothetical protein [Deltaproteobacteria bacterium]